MSKFSKDVKYSQMQKVYEKSNYVKPIMLKCQENRKKYVVIYVNFLLTIVKVNLEVLK